MTTKFTRGPWYWSDQYDTGQGHQTMSLLGDGGFGILSCDGLSNSPQYVNSNDAHLIAAAPMLYEALDAFVGWWDAGEQGPQYSSPDRREGPDGEAEWRRWWADQLDRAALAHSLGRAALKAARGES